MGRPTPTRWARLSSTDDDRRRLRSDRSPPRPAGPLGIDRHPEPALRAALPHDRHDRGGTGARAAGPGEPDGRRQPGRGPRDRHRHGGPRRPADRGDRLRHLRARGARDGRDPARGGSGGRPAGPGTGRRAGVRAVARPTGRRAWSSGSRTRAPRPPRTRPSRRLVPPGRGPPSSPSRRRSPGGRPRRPRRRDRTSSTRAGATRSATSARCWRRPRSARTCRVERSTPTRSLASSRPAGSDEAGAERIAARFADAAHLIVIASGADRPAGRELVLKVEEASWLPSAYRDLETFLHGHLPATGTDTALVLILADRDGRAGRVGARPGGRSGRAHRRDPVGGHPRGGPGWGVRAGPDPGRAIAGRPKRPTLPAPGRRPARDGHPAPAPDRAARAGARHRPRPDPPRRPALSPPLPRPRRADSLGPGAARWCVPGTETCVGRARAAFGAVRWRSWCVPRAETCVSPARWALRDAPRTNRCVPGTVRPTSHVRPAPHRARRTNRCVPRTTVVTAARGAPPPSRGATQGPTPGRRASRPSRRSWSRSQGRKSWSMIRSTPASA